METKLRELWGSGGAWEIIQCFYKNDLILKNYTITNNIKHTKVWWAHEY